MDLIFLRDSRVFEEPIPEFKGYGPFFREVCISLVREQFEDALPYFKYPKLEIRSDGQRLQAINHQRVNPRVCQIPENAVMVLRSTTPPEIVDSFKEISLL